MKKSTLLFTAFLVFSLYQGNSNPKENKLPVSTGIESFTIVCQYDIDHTDQKYRRYEFEKGMATIVSKVIQAGIEIITETTLYILDYGLRESRYIKETRNIKMLNRVDVTESHTIMDNEWLITIKDGKTTKIKNPAWDLMEGMTDKQAEQFGKGMMDAFKAETREVGTEIIAGVRCQITETVTKMMGVDMISRQWMYKGLVFKSSTKGLGSNVTEEILTFKENADVSEKHFVY